MLKIPKNSTLTKVIILVLFFLLGISAVYGDGNLTVTQAAPLQVTRDLQGDTSMDTISPDSMANILDSEQATVVIPSQITSYPVTTAFLATDITTITNSETPVQSVTLTPTPEITVLLTSAGSVSPTSSSTQTSATPTQTETMTPTSGPKLTETATPLPSISPTISANNSGSSDTDWKSSLPDPPLNGGNILGTPGAQYWEINGTTGPGIYFLEQNLDTSSLFGIWIHDVIGVVLDGMGYTLHGSGTGDGVKVEKVTNVEIRNITIIGWTNGISVSDVTNGNITDGTVAKQNNVGILAKDSKNIDVKSSLSPFIPSPSPDYNNKAVYTDYNNRSGIEFLNVTGGEISSTSATNNGPAGTYYRYGVNLTDSNGIFVMYVNASKNGDSGIAVNYGGGNTLSNNRANYNTAAGYYLQHTDFNTVTGNSANKNGNYGLYIAFVNGSEFSGNSIVNHGANGAQFIVSNQNEINNNVILNSNLSGLVLYESNGNNVVDNTISNNFFNGVEVLNESNTHLTNNDINNNYNGIWLGTAEFTTVTGNKVSGNTYSGLIIVSSGNNTIYNNYFNNQRNVLLIGNNQGNSWNTVKTKGTNIVGGPYIGGNYWGSPDGTGYSQVSTNTNIDGFIETPYNIPSGSSIDKDLLPLSTRYSTASPTVSPTATRSQGITRINVTTIETTPAEKDYDAILQKLVIPPIMKRKGGYIGTINLENSGNAVWTENSTSLMPLYNSTLEFVPGKILIPVPYVVKGQTVNFRFRLTAPEKSGSYILRFQLRGPPGFFGPVVEQSVKVQ